MRGLRATLRAFGMLAGLLVGVLVVAIVVSQTAWFRDWLRRYAIREAAQFVNGQLVIGRIDGSLWGGVQLHDVRITRDGETVVGLNLLDLEYSLIDFVRDGIVVNRVELVRPVVHLRREDEGWNVATLLVPQPPSDPDAPRTTFRVDSLILRDGIVTVDDPGCPPDQVGCLPARVDGLRLEGSVESSPEALDVRVEDAALQTSDPSVAVQRLAAALQMTDTDLQVVGLELRTAASVIQGDAKVEDYAMTPAVDAEIVASPLALTEVARFVPQLGPTTLAPTIRLSARGPLEALRLDLATTSDAGELLADVVVDAAEPGYGVAGTASVRALDVGAWMGDPTQSTRLTATTTLDVTGSDLASLSGRVSLEASDLEAQGHAVEQLQATADIDAGVASISAEARAYGTGLTSAGTVNLTQADTGAVHVDLRGDVRGLDVSRLPASLGTPPLLTNVSLGYHVTGTPEQLDASATFAPSTVDTMTIVDGSTIDVSVRGDRIGYDVQAHLRDIDVQRLGQSLRIAAIDAPAYASDIDARVAVAGEGVSLETAVADADVHVTGSTIGGADIPDLRVDVTARRGAVDARATGRLEHVRPERFTGRDDLTGDVSGNLELAVSIADVTGEIDPAQLDARAVVTLDPSEVGGVTIDEARVDVMLAQGRGEVRALHVVSPVIDVDASGPISLVESDASRLSYDVHVKDAGAVADLAGIAGVAGTAQVQGVIEGPPQRLVADGALTADDIMHADTASVEHVSGTYRVMLPDQDVARLDAALDVEATGVDASGTRLDTVTLEGRYAEQVATFDVDLTQDDLQVGATGRAEILDAAQVVTLTRLEARSPQLAWALASDAGPRIHHENGRVHVEGLRLADGTQQLDVDGVVQLPSDDVAFAADDLHVRATAIDIAPLGEHFAPEQQLAGLLDLVADLTGTLDAAAGSARVTLRDGSVRGFAFDALTAEADVVDGAAALDATMQQDVGSALTVTGRVPLPSADGTPAGSMDLTVGGPGIDLAVIEGLTDQVEEMRGRLVVDAQVTGTFAQPVVDGAIGIRDGAFRVPRVNAAYEGLQADVRLSQDAVRIDQFELRDGQDNALSVTGSLALDGTALQDVQMHATASEFRLLDNELGDVRLTADLAVSGTADAPTVRGELSLPSSLVDIDRLLDALAGDDAEDLRNDEDYVYTPASDVLAEAEAAVDPPPEIDLDEADQPARADVADEPQDPPEGDPVAVVADATAAAQPTLLEAATVDVRIVVPGDLVIRGDDVRIEGGPSMGGLNLTVGADLHATSAAGEPLVLTGEVTTVRGYYDFQGRRFTVVRDGTVQFDGADITDPSLDIAATRDISGVEARIDVLGTAQQPRLALSSTPALDEADILALIVFNRPLDDLGSGEQVSLARRAGELVGGRLTGGLATTLRDAIGVDQFEIDAFAASGPNVTLGNRLGERIYVRIRQQLGGQDVSQILLEYELLQNLRLQTSMTPGGRTTRSPGQRIERTGIDLLYFFYY